MAEGKCRERSLMKKGIETTSSEERWESGWNPWRAARSSDLEENLRPYLDFERIWSACQNWILLQKVKDLVNSNIFKGDDSMSRENSPRILNLNIFWKLYSASFIIECHTNMFKKFPIFLIVSDNGPWRPFCGKIWVLVRHPRFVPRQLFPSREANLLSSYGTKWDRLGWLFDPIPDISRLSAIVSEI
jgi:hypothetical protein